MFTILIQQYNLLFCSWHASCFIQATMSKEYNWGFSFWHAKYYIQATVS